MDIVYASELSRAASNHDEKQVASLLASNASVHDKDSLEQTPLILCVRGRADDEAAAEAIAACTKLLIEAGADVNTPDSYGDQPLALCCMHGGGVPKTGAVKVLLDANADVLAVTDNFKMTPLHWAATCGSTEICKMLIDAGARKNKIDRHRMTPIALAREQRKRLQDNLDDFGEEYKGSDKLEKLKAYSQLIDYFESVPGLKKD
uniref:Uncharacterized protein n=1 Tax=Chrysotila carterae TaxID=13221 RepID=A0A7S4BWC9_CHRCT|mmetsp:Transcript_44656/g.93189  ORF Transcript_44656/g.93189 Transcript_44656/m.93189 type:complete len:205 (+) Transcript_44656:111-725(+)